MSQPSSVLTRRDWRVLRRLSAGNRSAELLTVLIVEHVQSTTGAGLVDHRSSHGVLPCW